ncbi:MAG: hypothetical protein OHK005_15100 [Candidatus Methylacidiphilales bacterium]
MFCRRDGIAARGIHDHDAEFAGRSQIHVINPHPSAPDNFEPIGRFHGPAGDFGLTPHDEGVNALDLCDQFSFRKAFPNGDPDVRDGGEFFDAFWRDAIKDENMERIRHDESQEGSGRRTRFKLGMGAKTKKSFERGKPHRVWNI